MESMGRLARRGILINDLQGLPPPGLRRIYGLTRPAAASEMIAERRGPHSQFFAGFRRPGNSKRFRHKKPGFEHVSIQWCWAFRLDFT